MTDQSDQKVDDKPTEEQVKTANELEKAKWEGDFSEEELQVPYKAEETESKPKNEEEPKPSDEEIINAVEYEEPTTVITVADPGEYKPADYSFQVTLKDGKTETVKSPEDAQKIADDPENFETPAQLMDFINKQNKMNRNLERDEEKYQDQKTKFDEQSQEESQRIETVQNFSAEFEYLVNKDLLPKVPKKYREADWQDAEVASQPSVKAHTDLLDYLLEENKVRAKAGVKPLTSIIDAYSGWKLEQDQKLATEAKNEAGQARKAAGARVAGVSANEQQPYIPKGIAVGNPNIFKRDQAMWDN